MASAPKIAFIGAGKVGCSLARYLQEGGTELVGFFSRTSQHAAQAATFAGGVAFESSPNLIAAADVTFLTCTDTELPKIARQLGEDCAPDTLRGKVIAHCSGALGSEVLAPLREAGAAVASCHPLYAVSSRFDCWQELSRAWFTLEGDDAAVDALEALLAKCGNHVARIPAGQKVRYHAAAVMASNLVVGLYETAVRELESCGFSAQDAQDALAPLFLGNAQHIASDGVAASLTGPAARHDSATIDAHLSCLSGDSRQIYRLLTDVLYSIADQHSQNG